MPCIYRVINTINQRSYIGFTRHTAANRFKRHWTDSKRTRFPFHVALRKYGKEFFTVEVLEESDDADFLLNQRESFWISQFNNTYNVQTGGEGRCISSPVFLHELNGSVSEYASPISAASALGISVERVHLALNRYLNNKASGIKSSDGTYYVVTRSREDRGTSHQRFSHKKKIVDEYGVMYDSAFDAAKEFSVSHQRIRKAVKTGARVSGVLLRYVEE